MKEGKDGGRERLRVSPKLDGVYARATREGIFSRSGKRLDLPHVEGRLKRHFRRHPEGALAGELWRKGEGLERISGAARAGGAEAKKLRLHVFPDQGPRPLPLGAVRRVKAKTAKDERKVEKLYRKALRQGHEGVMIRHADGRLEKRKPRADAEYEVAAVLGGRRNVLQTREGWKVQARPGVQAKEGDRVQVSYSGMTRKGVPRAAVAERVRNDHDFDFPQNNMKHLDAKTTPAAAILGAGFFDGLMAVPAGPMGRLRHVELRQVDAEEELARDRKTLRRIAAGGVAAGVGMGLLVGKSRADRLRPKRAAAARGKELLKRGLISPGEAKFFETPAQRLGVVEPKRRRDKLERARDVAVIGGMGALGAGSLAVGAGGVATGVAARQVSRKAVDAMGSVGDAAREVGRKVQGKEVVREGVKVLKEGTKRYFPTVGKVARVMRKRVFETPAQRLGLVELGTANQLREAGSNVYANPLLVAAGAQRAYRTGMKGHVVDLPVADAQVVRAAYRKAGAVSKWGSRAGALGKDALDVVRGKPRERDASGRKKKREWEKSWAKNMAKQAAVAGGALGWAAGMKSSPKFRRANIRAGRWVRNRVNDWVPNTFETPAQRLGVLAFSSREDAEDRADRVVRAGLRGGAAGAAVGGMIGSGAADISPLVDASQVVRKDGGGTAGMRLGRRGGGGVAVREHAVAPFGRGKMGEAERMARRKHIAGVRAEKLRWKQAHRKVLRSAAKRGGAGALAGAVVSGVAAASLASAARREGKEKRAFSAVVPGGEGQAARKKRERQAVMATRRKKEERAARVRNALVGAGAGAFLGGQLYGGKSGYAGARVGAALGGLYGATGQPRKAREVLEEVQGASFSTPARKLGVVALSWGEKRREGPERFRKLHKAAISAAEDEMRNDPKLRAELLRDGWVKERKHGGGDVWEFSRTPARRILGFDALAEDAGWDIRDPRGRSARVYAPGAGKRERREKRWHEKIENERKLWRAAVASAAVAAGAAGLAGGRKLGGAKTAGAMSAGVPAVVRGRGGVAVPAAVRRLPLRRR